MKRFLSSFVVVLVLAAAVMSTACESQTPDVVKAMATDQMNGNKPFASSIIGDYLNLAIFVACAGSEVVIVATDDTKRAENVVTTNLSLGEQALCGAELKQLRRTAVQLYNSDRTAAEALGISYHTVEILNRQIQ